MHCWLILLKSKKIRNNVKIKLLLMFVLSITLGVFGKDYGHLISYSLCQFRTLRNELWVWKRTRKLTKEKILQNINYSGRFNDGIKDRIIILYISILNKHPLDKQDFKCHLNESLQPFNLTLEDLTK